MKGRRLDPVFTGSLRQSKAFAKYLMANIAALIQFLIGAGNPTAIFRRVWSIVVDAVEGMANGARPHIGKKVGERLNPSGADYNAAPAVVGVFLAVLRVTAPLHLRPTGHGGCVCHPVLQLFAPATFRPARLEIAPKDAALSPTNAPAKAAAATAFQHSPIVHLHGVTISRGSNFIKEYQHD